MTAQRYQRQSHGDFQRLKWRFLALSLLYVACEGGETSGRESVGVEGGQHLSGTVLIPPDQLKEPQALVVAGPHLVVADGTDSILHWFDRRTGQSLWTRARQGSGPGELQLVWSLQSIAQEDSSYVLWAFDKKEYRVTGYQASARVPPELVGNPIRVQPPGASFRVLWASDSLLVASGLFTGGDGGEGRLYLLDREGRPVRALGAIPLVSKRIPSLVAQQILQPSMVVRPGGGLVAVGARYAGRLDIYSLTTGSLVPAKVPFTFIPEVRVDMRNGTFPVFAPTQHVRLAYVSVTGSYERIYALFSGRTRARFPLDAYLGTQVHAFSWDGVLLGIVDLGRDIFKVAVTPDDSVLYAMTLDPKPAVYSYDVSQLFPLRPGSR